MRVRRSTGEAIVLGTASFRRLAVGLLPRLGRDARPKPVTILQRTFCRLKHGAAQPWPGFSFPCIALRFHDRLTTITFVDPGGGGTVWGKASVRMWAERSPTPGAPTADAPGGGGAGDPAGPGDSRRVAVARIESSYNWNADGADADVTRIRASLERAGDAALADRRRSTRRRSAQLRAGALTLRAIDREVGDG